MGGTVLANLPGENHLAEQQYITLIVRLMVDQHAKLIRGEIVNDTNTFRERFMGGHELIAAMQTWLARVENMDGSQTPDQTKV
jgi:hypothetical protein